MKELFLRLGNVKTLARLVFIPVCIVASIISHAQVDVYHDTQDSTVMMKYLGTRDNVSKMLLQIKNPRKDIYKITISDTYKGMGEFENVLFEEYNKKPAYATTFVVPDEVKSIEIVVENRKTKMKSTFYANRRYVSNHDVVITRVREE